MQITETIFTFLKELQKNNTREWFSEHKKEYENCEKEMKSFFQEIYLNLQKTDSIESMKMFRIYRDVRFSKDKTPYKTSFSCAYMRTKPYLRGGYYIHIEPDNNFIGGGFWEPNKDDLLRIRKEFEMDPHTIKKITSDKKFIETFGELTGEELKTAPKGFEKDLLAMDLIRKKQYLVMKKYTEEQVLSKDFESGVISDFQVMRPFFNYMSDVLKTNLNGEVIY